MSNPDPEIPSQLGVTATEAARMFNLSPRTWRKLASEGRIPAPRMIGRSKRWSVDELRAWFEAGCPDRVRWERLRGKNGA